MTIAVFYKDTREVFFQITCVAPGVVDRPDFSQSPIFENVEIWIFFYMRVSNYHESPLLLLHLLIHPVHLLVGETSCIKGKIFGVTGVVYIHPQHINLEFVQSEISVTLDYCFSS